MNKLSFALIACIAASAAHADSTTTISQFESRLAAARTSTSDYGTTVERSEMAYALHAFVEDDGVVDATESGYIDSANNGETDPNFFDGVTGQAQAYLDSFNTLNNGQQVSAALAISPQGDAATLFGADGALAASADVRYGTVTGGTLNQFTLQTVAGSSYQSSVGPYSPVNYGELIGQLYANTVNGSPTADEVNGTIAYLNGRESSGTTLPVFYVAQWSAHDRGAPGDIGGYSIAVALPDNGTGNRTVTFLEVTTWTE